MSKNTLFNFIKNHVYQGKGKGKKQPFKGGELISSITRDGKSYFRFDLPHPKNISLTDEKLNLTLTAHHISVYQNQKDNNPFLSQYHYTADFLGNGEQNYKLHIYFNNNDELATEPSLTVQTPKEFTPVDSIAFKEQFLNLALLHTQIPLAELRKLQNQTITTLQNSINALEEKASALSENLQSNYEAYQETTDQILAETQVISPLVQHENYTKMYRITSLLKEQLATEHAKSQQQGDYQSSSLPSADEIEIAPSKSHSKKSKRTQKKRHTTPKIDLEASVTALASRFANLDRENLETFTAEINELHTDFYQISLLVEKKNKGTKLSVDRLKQLQQLGIDIKNTGKELLFKLLPDGHFDLAKQLKPYHYMLNANHLNQALQDRNPELLDFLLTVGDFAVNTQTVTIDEQLYNSPVYFCVNANSKKKSTAACLSVLIKHNASLLVPAKKGLPLAHTILSTPEHLLKATLTESQTLNNSNFYKQLVVAIEHYLRTHPINDVTQKNLEQSIEHYKVKINQFSLLSKLDGTKGTKKEGLYEEFNRAKSELSELNERVRQHLFSQPIITSLLVDIDYESQIFLDKLNKSQRRSLGFHFREACNAENTTMATHNYDENACESITQHVQHYLENQLLYFQKINELFELLELIRSCRSGKDKSKILKKQNSLSTEIKKLGQSKGLIAFLNEQSDFTVTTNRCMETITNEEATSDEIATEIAETIEESSSLGTDKLKAPQAGFFSKKKSADNDEEKKKTLTLSS